jgi:multidrug efflux pump subunit AcrA (membrane-fusion protein)
VAAVDAGGHVRLAPVKLGTDFGSGVEILSGVDTNTRIIVNPADSLADGDVVSVVNH